MGEATACLSSSSWPATRAARARRGEPTEWAARAEPLWGAMLRTRHRAVACGRGGPEARARAASAEKFCPSPFVSRPLTKSFCLVFQCCNSQMRALKVLVVVVAGEMCVRGTEWSAGARVLRGGRGGSRGETDLPCPHRPARASGHLFFKLGLGQAPETGECDPARRAAPIDPSGAS